MNCKSVLCAIAIALLAVNRLLLPSAVAATLEGHQVQGGATLEFQSPISSYFQESAAQGGNPRPTAGGALLMFPKNFDPARSWPILIVTSTTDLDRTSIMDAPWYRDAAMKEGWIVFATDAAIRPRVDSVSWRFTLFTAGVRDIFANFSPH